LLWNTENAPRYRSGLILALVSWLVFIPTVAVYWASCVYENRRRQNQVTIGSVDISEHLAEVVGRDVTDKQDKTFRYTF
jgi:hypothetical protein